MEKPRFNDDYYHQTVEEWENTRLPSLLITKGLTWGVTVGISTFVAGGYFAGGDWKRWAAITLVAFLIWKVFVFLEELNENIRFVRHQLRTFRDAVRESQNELSKYHHPEKLGACEVIELLDRLWSQP